MPSLLLILPADASYRYQGAFRKSYSYAPLTLVTLAALVPKEHGFSIKIVDEGVQSPQYDDCQYDLVGITCVTSSSIRAYELCRHFKSKGAHVVLGGAHPTLVPQEAMQHADTVIVGPAEKSWPQCINDFLQKRPRTLYSTKANDHSSTCYPLPRRDLIRPGLYLDVPTVIASPGCLNDCDFCSIPTMGQACLGSRSVDHVVREISTLGKRQLLFLDPNITVDRVYAKKLFTALMPLRLRWAGLASIDVVQDDELLKLMVESGCRGLLIGFESLDQSNLLASGKAFARVSEYGSALTMLRSAGVFILGCFILGFDQDTSESLHALPHLVDALKIDLPRYSILTPFPGTRLFDSLNQAGRILTKDWSLYDTEHVVFRPRAMDPEELQSALYSGWKTSYRLPEILKRTMRLEHSRVLGALANFGFRHYSKRLYALRRSLHGTFNSH